MTANRFPDARFLTSDKGGACGEYKGQLRVLRKNRDAWNWWRGKHSDGPIYLSVADLRKAYLSEAHPCRLALEKLGQVHSEPRRKKCGHHIVIRSASGQTRFCSLAVQRRQWSTQMVDHRSLVCRAFRILVNFRIPLLVAIIAVSVHGVAWASPEYGQTVPRALFGMINLCSIPAITTSEFKTTL